MLAKDKAIGAKLQKKAQKLNSMRADLASHKKEILNLEQARKSIK